MREECLYAWAACHKRTISAVCIKYDEERRRHEVYTTDFEPGGAHTHPPAGGAVLIVNYNDKHFDALLPAQPHDSR